MIPTVPCDPIFAAERYQRRGWTLLSTEALVHEGFEVTCGVCGDPVDRIELWGPAEPELSRFPFDQEEGMVAFPCRHTTDDVPLDGRSCLAWIRKRFVPGPIELVPA